MTDAYKEAGVDIAAGDEAVKRLAGHARKTHRPEVLSGVGGFGGLFQLPSERFREPVLVAGTDGVGTKLKLAFALDRYDTVGIDAVAMCVNDILVHGAEPLFFLDYLACSKLDPIHVEQIVKGIAAGCVDAGCALIGGETAEMPGFYQPGDYDIAGFAVGVVEKEAIIDGARIQPDDVILALPSSGVHSNGFSLVRKVLAEKPAGYLQQAVVGDEPLGDLLLTPTRIYVRPVQSLLAAGTPIKGIAHITGGGITNITRILPPNCQARLESGSWPIAPIFAWLQQEGCLTSSDMYTTFNMGIGMILVVEPAAAALVQERLAAAGEAVYAVGRIVSGQQSTVWEGEAP